MENWLQLLHVLPKQSIDLCPLEKYSEDLRLCTYESLHQDGLPGHCPNSFHSSIRFHSIHSIPFHPFYPFRSIHCKCAPRVNCVEFQSFPCFSFVLELWGDLGRPRGTLGPKKQNIRPPKNRILARSKVHFGQTFAFSPYRCCRKISCSTSRARRPTFCHNEFWLGRGCFFWECEEN